MDRTSFFESVYEVVRLVPPGRVTTYGAIAHFLGSGKSARMVGYALNASHGMSGVPAHRVVNRNGRLTGKVHFNPPSLMQELLEKENILVVDDEIVGFDQLFWNPVTELL